MSIFFWYLSSPDIIDAISMRWLQFKNACVSAVTNRFCETELFGTNIHLKVIFKFSSNFVFKNLKIYSVRQNTKICCNISNILVTKLTLFTVLLNQMIRSNLMILFVKNYVFIEYKVKKSCFGHHGLKERFKYFH